MIQDLFINAIIIITFITLGNQLIFKEKSININSPLSLRIIFGALSGVVGCILMIYSVNVAPNVILDLRQLAIILAAFFGGPVSAIITSIFIGAFRILYFGFHTSSLIAVIALVIIGLECSVIAISKLSMAKKWVYSTIISTFTFSLVFIILITNKTALLKLLLAYWVVTLLVSFVLYKYLNYIKTSNELFRKYKEESTMDFLTGLNNVRQFDNIFNSVSGNAIEKEEHLSLLFIDIDHFKKVNDTYGHSEGDVVLKELGQILLKTCRSFDIVSRNGGEEFSVMLLDCLPEQALIIAERIRSAVEKQSFILTTGKIIHITVSIGIATYPNTTTDMGKLKEEADSALYKAKRTGRNKVVLQERVCIGCIDM